MMVFSTSFPDSSGTLPNVSNQYSTNMNRSELHLKGSKSPVKVRFSHLLIKCFIQVL
uniref:Uncharacterized protein n=1 Tax=Anguilla anguilla TaxID=7936 RepID=A0A0E9WLZ6_ANGAN